MKLNRLIIGVALISIFVFLLTIFTEKINVKEGYFAIKLRAGEIKEIVLGPGTFEKAYFSPLAHIIISENKKEVIIDLSKSNKIKLTIKVLDAKLFYFSFRASYEILTNYCSEKIQGLTYSQAKILLEKVLNRKEMGISAKIDLL